MPQPRSSNRSSQASAPKRPGRFSKESYLSTGTCTGTETEGYTTTFTEGTTATGPTTTDCTTDYTCSPTEDSGDDGSRVDRIMKVGVRGGSISSTITSNNSNTSSNDPKTQKSDTSSEARTRTRVQKKNKINLNSINSGETTADIISDICYYCIFSLTIAFCLGFSPLILLENPKLNSRNGFSINKTCEIVKAVYPDVDFLFDLDDLYDDSSSRTRKSIPKHHQKIKNQKTQCNYLSKLYYYTNLHQTYNPFQDTKNNLKNFLNQKNEFYYVDYFSQLYAYFGDDEAEINKNKFSRSKKIKKELKLLDIARVLPKCYRRHYIKVFGNRRFKRLDERLRGRSVGGVGMTVLQKMFYKVCFGVFVSIAALGGDRDISRVGYQIRNMRDF